MFNDKERELLDGLRGPDAQLIADAKLYVRDTAYRARVDALDKQAGTSLGPKLRAIGLELPEPAPQKPVAQQPTEHELAEAIKKYPNKQSVSDILNSPMDAWRKLKKSDPAEFRAAKIAGIFHGLPLSLDSANSVKFNYETSRDRAAKREAVAAKAQADAEALPPGVSKCADGIGYYTSDPEAFAAWKESQSDKAVIAAAREEQE